MKIEYYTHGEAPGFYTRGNLSYFLVKIAATQFVAHLQVSRDRRSTNTQSVLVAWLSRREVTDHGLMFMTNLLWRRRVTIRNTLTIGAVSAFWAGYTSTWININT